MAERGISFISMQGFFPSLNCFDMPSDMADGRALVLGGKEVSFAELYLCARAIATGLDGLGLDRDRPLAIMTRSSESIAMMVYAARIYGIPILPLSPDMEYPRRDLLLAECGCKQVLAEGELFDLPAGVRMVVAESLVSPGDLDAGVMPAAWQGASGAQLVIATSGSEGKPKGVMLSGSNLAASALAVERRFELDRGDLWLCCLPLNHIGGISILYRCLHAGAGVLLHEGFSAGQVWLDLLQQGVTHISLVPAMLAALLDRADGVAPPASLKLVLVGGGPLDPQLAARAHAAGWPVCASYGMSETASICFADQGAGSGVSAGRVGKPIGDFEYAVSDQGRIRLRGPAVMLGYANPELAPGLGLEPDGWFETGDLGRFDADGCLQLLGRVDDVLVSGGKNIHPLEVEGLLSACPGVERIAVTGVPDEQWGDLLVAIYLGDVTTSELEAWCRENLPSTLRPRRFQQVRKLPLNHMGKLKRELLPGLVKVKG